MGTSVFTSYIGLWSVIISGGDELSLSIYIYIELSAIVSPLVGQSPNETCIYGFFFLKTTKEPSNLSLQCFFIYLKNH